MCTKKMILSSNTFFLFKLKAELHFKLASSNRVFVKDVVIFQGIHHCIIWREYTMGAPG